MKPIPIYDPYKEAELKGYQIAARQHREGKRIAKPLGTWSRVAFFLIVFVLFAAVALTAGWVMNP